MRDPHEASNPAEAQRIAELEHYDRPRFEQAVLPHLNAAYNLARWLTQDDHASEDCVQEAYYRAARYFSSFRGGDGRAWLLGIVRRAVLDWLAKHRGEAPEVYSDDIHGKVDDSLDPSVQVIRKNDQERVRAALAALSAPLREAIVLRELEGLSYREIAAVTETAIGTVMSRISRARVQLQRLLSTDEVRAER